MSRSHVVGPKAALLTIGIAAAVLFVTGCGDSGDDAEKINLIAAGTKVTEVDNGEAGPSIGDVNVIDSPLTFADGGSSAGNLYGIQTTVSLDASKEIVQASFTFKLENGTISIGGLSEYPKGDNALTQGQEFERPVIGGTGDYSGASGTDTTVLNSDGLYEHELVLDD